MPVCPEKSWTCDFVIDNRIWIEVDGMKNNRSVPYQSGENEKIQYYKDNNMKYEIISYRNSNIPRKLLAIISRR